MRKSRFAGSFYPSDKAAILEFVDTALREAKVESKPNEHIAYVAPHAGYAYSGKCAAYTYRALELNMRMPEMDTVIIIGPNHTGMGKAIAVSLDDWETPVGTSINDSELSGRITESSNDITIDETAHAEEHSIEVQLPFLQRLFPDKKIVPVCMGDQSLEACELLSDAIVKSVESLKRKAIIIASSDLDHYESAKVAERKDSALLEAAKTLDHERFRSLVYELEDSACGLGPITVAMIFAAHMGAKNGRVLRYTNSGESTGDYSSVVGYSSIAFL